MTKREFLAVLGTAAATTLAPRAAWAQAGRILGGPRGPDDPGVAASRSAELAKFVSAVRVGARKSHGGLHVFWLHGAPATAPIAIATPEEARERGELTITERERASVPSVVVENLGKRHVLLLAGEILLGGKQNRVVTEDVLLPPLSGPVDLQVYCVEQGRWNPEGSRAGFSARGTFAAPQLRSKVIERQSQGEVWAEVDKYAQHFAAPSPTQSYQAIYDKAEVKAHQAEAEAALDQRTASGALGAAVFTSSSFAALDLFQDAGLFAREWPKLLRAHALDTYQRPSLKDTDEQGVRAQVEALLRRAGSVEGTLRRNAGIGRLFEFRVDRKRGSALIAEGQVVHTAVL